MDNLVPEGSIPLFDAWEQFHDYLWNGHDPIATLSNINFYVEEFPHSGKKNRMRHQNISEIDGLQHIEFLNPFEHGVLEALVRPQGSLENFIIPKSAWDQTFYLERMFLAREIMTCSPSCPHL